MFRIVEKKTLNAQVKLLRIKAEKIAQKAQPGQFVILQIDKQGERIPLTISDYDREKGLVTIIFQEVGATTKKLGQLEEGDSLLHFVGPLGRASELEGYKKVCVIGGGLGCVIAYPQAKALSQMDGVTVDCIAGFRSKDIIILEEEMKKACRNLYVVTDDGSNGNKGFVTNVLQKLLDGGEDYDLVIAIGPVVMMKAVSDITREKKIKTIVSMNSIMIDGTGMCGGCRVTVGGETKFACVDGPDFDGHLVDFATAARRGNMYKAMEREADCKLMTAYDEKPNMQPHKTPMREIDPEERIKSFDEVACGYSEEEAQNEAQRCLNCRNRPCMEGCPVNVRIPDFIKKIREKDYIGAYNIIKETNSLPAVCGRVCPQENQCEKNCVRGIKGESVGIGRLERFAADYFLQNGGDGEKQIAKNGIKCAVVGSGPAGLTCAGDLASAGFDVTVFEALHISGGVLMYGIPQFRLPKEIVEREISTLREMGVKIVKDVVIGKTELISELFDEGYKAVFVASGAGLPNFMGIEGETLNGVFSSNEILTRINLMKGYKSETDTPVYIGKRVAVVGGGNVAMDSARCARRLGAEKVYIVYRRSMDEIPARAEEIEHAWAEGVEFCVLTNPTRIIGDENGCVKGIECVKMQLGEPDASGRRRPEAIDGSEHIMDVDTVIIAIGQSPNPLIRNTTEGLETNRRGGIVVNEETMETSLEGVYAGGDAVTGAATVILAMGAGKAAAKAIKEKLL